MQSSHWREPTSSSSRIPASREVLAGRPLHGWRKERKISIEILDMDTVGKTIGWKLAQFRREACKDSRTVKNENAG